MKNNEQDAFARAAETANKTHPPLVKTAIQDKAELERLYPTAKGTPSMSDEQPLEPTDLYVVMEEQAMALLQQYRELEKQWLDAPNGSAEFQALSEQLHPLRMKLVVWLNVAVGRAEDAVAKGE